MDVLALLDRRSAALRSGTNAPPGSPSSYDPTDPADERASSGRRTPRDTVAISSEAREAARTEPQESAHEREDFGQVKRGMRALIDARQRLTGTTLTKETKMATVKDLFGDITDRRALFAVYGDDAETFTEDEKKAAKWLELQLKKDSYAKLPKDDRIIGLTNYLDKASAEEKATFQWIKDRADAQAGLYGSLDGWRRLKDYGGVKTGDQAVDDLVSRLTLNMLMNWKSKTDYTKTSAYAKIKKDFDALADTGRAFTFASGDKPEGLIGFLNRAGKEQRTMFQTLRTQANSQNPAAGGAKSWWQNGGKNAAQSNWWSSAGSGRKVGNAIALYNTALNIRRP